MLMIVIMAVTMVVMEYRTEQAKAQLRAHTSAHVVATQFEWLLEASAQTLRRIERAINERGFSRQGEAIVDLNAAVENLPPTFQFSVYDAAGELAYSSISNAPRVNVSDRTYYQELRRGAELVISPALVSRQDGRSVFIIARRIMSEGTFFGVATIAVPATILADLSESLGLGAGSTVSLIRSDGMLVSRAPPIEAKDLSDSQVFLELKKARSGTYQAVSPADGVRRIVGYWQVTGWPVVAIAALDQRQVLGEFWRVLQVWLILAAPVLFVLGFVVNRLFKALRRDEQKAIALAAANERNAFLLREIHHRVKNNLQTVMSLIRLQKMPQDDKDSLLGRIASMVAVHQEMYSTDRFETVEAAGYLKRLVDEIAQAYGREVDVTFNADPVQLSGDRAMQLGLLYNELISNAFKHAWPAGEKGKLDVSLTEDEEAMVELVVADNGQGMGETNTKNMGSRLITAFVAQLGGEIETAQDDGTRVTVRFPVDQQGPEEVG
jgi:two-component sensor histidine kinase